MRTQETEDNMEQAEVRPFRPAEDAPLAGSAHLARHAERLDRYQQLVQLREEGLTQKEIARRLRMGERTVRHWLTRGIPYGKPELRHKRNPGFDPYAAYVRERWEQGHHNGLQLWRELQAASDIREVRRQSTGSSISSSKVPIPQIDMLNDHKLFESRLSSSGRPNKQSGGLSATRPISKRKSDKYSRSFVKPVRQPTLYMN